MNTISRKIGLNRGNARLWVEGPALMAANWQNGHRFNIEYKRGSIVLTKDKDGARKVAGTPDRPILDTNTNKITKALKAAPGDFTSIKIEADCITIKKASKAKHTLHKLAAAGLLAASVITPLLPSSAKAGAKRILVACEYSGRVRDALIQAGHNAISCDVLPSDAPGPHIQGDVSQVLADDWDMILAFPPCTYLTSAALWRNLPKHDPSGERAKKTETALQFVADIMNADCPQIMIENPVGCISTRLRRGDSGKVEIIPMDQANGAALPPSQSIQPHQFGHPESKRTCLWLKGLPNLTATNQLKIEDHGHQNETGKWYWQNQTPSGQNNIGPSADRWKIRSLTYSGIAAAIGAQWGQESKAISAKKAG